MIWLAAVLSMLALGISLWLAWEVAGLKQRWARLYGLRSAMVETETALEELMDELDKSGQTLLAELDTRLIQAQGIELSSVATRGEKSSAKTKVSPISLTDTEEKRVAVIGLGEQGYTVEEISRALGIPRGEVQLILDLDRFRQ
ncbi:MAG: hypothetical protein GX977_02310 [Firmicutes bacterium]|nr:hypothetical protein [Bacillota bacterium]